MRDQDTSDHGRSLGDTGDAGECEVEIPVCSLGKIVGVELFTVT